MAGAGTKHIPCTFWQALRWMAMMAGDSYGYKTILVCRYGISKYQWYNIRKTYPCFFLNIYGILYAIVLMGLQSNRTGAALPVLSTGWQVHQRRQLCHGSGRTSTAEELPPTLALVDKEMFFLLIDTLW